MKVLVTGFEPFGGEKGNPALEAIKGLPAEIHGAEVRWLEVPTVFHKSAQVLEEEMNRYQPDFVLCIGQAGGRTSLTPERVTINQDDACISDNEDNQPIDRPIRPDGASAYFSSLPIKAMVQAIKKEALLLNALKIANLVLGIIAIVYYKGDNRVGAAPSVLMIVFGGVSLIPFLGWVGGILVIIGGSLFLATLKKFKSEE